MKVLLGIQARSKSTRFPGKIFQTIGDQSLLERAWASVLEASQEIEKQGIQTLPTVLGPLDDEDLQQFCFSNNIRLYQPDCPEDDLIQRYRITMTEHFCTHAVRVTSDCWNIPAQLIQDFTLCLRGVDYLSNTQFRTFPEGWDLQGISHNGLHWVSDAQKTQREHPFFDLDQCYHTRELFEAAGFKIKKYMNENLSYLAKSFSIDTEQDLEWMRNWYEESKRPRK